MDASICQTVLLTIDGGPPSMSSTRRRFAVVAAAALALAAPLAVKAADATTTPTALQAGPAAATSFTPAQVLAGVQANMTTANKVNSKPHINTMTRAQNVNVYQVATGVYAYTSSMAIDTDGSDRDPDPDHQGQTTWHDSNGKALGAHHVPFYVLGDDCWDRKSPCPHFFYKDHNIKGRQFALMFYKGKVIGSIFGDTQTANNQTTSDNDSRELGEASVKAAQLLGIPSSGTTGGVDNGVTVVIFSGSSWVVNGTNSTLNTNTQAMVQNALDSLGTSMGLPGGGTPPPNDFSISASPSSGSVTAGGSATATVATAVTSGSAQSVALSTGGLPAGATASFSPSSVTAGGSATLTIATSSSTPAGTYPVAVAGTG